MKKKLSEILSFAILIFLFISPVAVLAAAYSPEIGVNPPGMGGFGNSFTCDFRYNRDTNNWEYNNAFSWGFKDVALNTQKPHFSGGDVIITIAEALTGKNEADGLAYFALINAADEFGEISGLDEASTNYQSYNNTSPSAQSSGQTSASPSQSSSSGSTDLTGSAIKPNLQVKIGQTVLDFGAITCKEGEVCQIDWIAKYVSALYQYGIGVAVILAIIMMMVGGLIWLMSAGSPDKVGKAKEFITAALSGLFLALFSFIILFTVNPRLVNLEPIGVNTISAVELSAGEATPEKARAAVAARTATPGGSSGSDINLFAVDHQTAVTEITQRGGQSGPPTTYERHDNDTNSAQNASDIWPSDATSGDETAKWLVDNADRLDIKYVIWKQQIWVKGRDEPGTWRKMEDRGSNTQNHFDHIHVSFNP